MFSKLIKPFFVFGHRGSPMCIPYAPRDRDVAIRLTCALLGAWTDNRDNLADLCGSVHSSAARANLQSRESLVRDTWYQSTVEKC